MYFILGSVTTRHVLVEESPAPSIQNDDVFEEFCDTIDSYVLGSSTSSDTAGTLEVQKPFSDETNTAGTSEVHEPFSDETILSANGNVQESSLEITFPISEDKENLPDGGNIQLLGPGAKTVNQITPQNEVLSECLQEKNQNVMGVLNVKKKATGNTITDITPPLAEAELTERFDKSKKCSKNLFNVDKEVGQSETTSDVIPLESSPTDNLQVANMEPQEGQDSTLDMGPARSASTPKPAPETAESMKCKRTLFLENTEQNLEQSNNLDLSNISSEADEPVNIFDVEKPIEVEVSAINASDLPPAQGSVVVLYSEPSTGNGETTENHSLLDDWDLKNLDFEEISEPQSALNSNEYGLVEFETSAVDVTPEKMLTRKRQRHQERWKKKMATTKLNKGEEHISVHGKLRRGRELKQPCFENCKFKCTSKVTENDRKEIFQSFWAIPTHARKWDFIGVHVSQGNTKRTTLEENVVSKRKHSRIYSFKIKGQKIRVCKTMFLSTLDICDGWVDTAMKKLDKGTGTISPDKRGKNVKTPKPENLETKEFVREHIRSLPRQPAHYSRATSNREYLIEDIQSIADMHSIYEDWMQENHPGKKKVTYRVYADIFNNEFNISFFIAKKDQCEDCVRWENATETEKEIFKPEFDQHILNKDLAQTMRIADTKVAQLKSSKNLCVACYDYEKTLICPKARASVYYYKRKLSVNNFTVVDAGRHEDYCYCYDESIAAKGSNEVASLVFDFITKKVDAGVTDFRFYSDNCTGQNKNRGVCAMYLHAAAKFNIHIRHRFLEKGHTWNAADNVHSLIERRVKNIDIYSPQEYYEKISTAKRNKKTPIQVIEVKQDMIFDWKEDLAEKLNLDIPWTKVREISVGAGTDHELKYRIQLDEESKAHSSKRIGRPVNLSNFVPKLVYTSGPRPISKAKYKDLMGYIEDGLIPEKYHDFFKALPSSSTVPDEPQEEPRNGRARKKKAPAPKNKRSGKKRKVAEESDPDMDFD
ncbi:Pleckstrin homology domain-containing family H member 1 [Frankliniella fusca]|uniref:Pleckstrin homology domain-containing family H member 1 n=1 Tax=Frankliniella fusca TaxID=407009 RepID=A0AAE1GPJ3_9NEOP|nr:Pleckstrin homology domain-containing family H member 1 [Frankliniella fusca]